jgi:DNA helicase-2/ATP-dependent DNA helicase PcrA
MEQSATTEQLLRGCDESQRAAITSPASPLLVIAGAGSGKTLVLTRRIAWRIACEKASPSASLALTFTRKAASELRERLRTLGLPSQVTAGTFHGVALAQLRQRAIDRGRPLPIVIDSKARILSGVLPELANRRQGRAPLDRRMLLSGFAGEIEWAKARMIQPENYATEAQIAGRTPPVDLKAVEEGYIAYEIERKRRRMYDFDDLLTTLAELIGRDAEFAASQRWKFRHLYVDEFQDANAAQLKLLEAWRGDANDLFCVGDARQSIYGWNGADPSAMENFSSRYHGATTLELSTNYRSTEQLVYFAHAALPKAAKRPIATREDGTVPTITAYASHTDEAISVAERVRKIALMHGSYSDCAVLARTNAQLILIERALVAAGIPVRQTGTDHFLTRSFVQRALQQLHGNIDRRQSGSQIFHNWLTDITTESPSDETPRSPAPSSRQITTEQDDEGDLATLLLIAGDYADLEPSPSPDGFQRYLEQSLRQDLLPFSSPAVDLLSFHRAKGLEWPIVFVVGLEDGYVPISQAKTRSALAEEQRLLYVALSRASEELHLSWAKTRAFSKRVIPRDPSPYLDALMEMQQKLIENQRVDPARAKAAFAEGRAILASSEQIIST